MRQLRELVIALHADAQALAPPSPGPMMTKIDILLTLSLAVNDFVSIYIESHGFSQHIGYHIISIN